MDGGWDGDVEHLDLDGIFYGCTNTGVINVSLDFPNGNNLVFIGYVVQKDYVKALWM